MVFIERTTKANCIFVYKCEIMNKFYQKLIILIAVLSMTHITFAQSVKTDKKLQKTLEEITKDHQGDVGVYVYHLKKHKEVAINADTIFPTASVVKVPILIGLFKKISDGKYTLNQPMVYDDSRAYGGSGLMQFYKDSSQTDLRTLASLMITYSDNTTSLWCQELAGGGAEINKLMADIGLKDTRVNSRTEGREKIWEIYGWGQTTPREMASLLIKIRKDELIDKVASEQMYRLMTSGFYVDNAASQIPPYVQKASKTGAVDASRSELIMVNAPHGDYVLYIGTKNNKDRSWTYDNEASQLMRDISAAVWHHFEPKANWEPAKGTEALKRDQPY